MRGTQRAAHGSEAARAVRKAARVWHKPCGTGLAWELEVRMILGAVIRV